MARDEERGTSPDIDKDKELEELFALYVDQLNRGEKFHPQEILAKHPLLGEELLQSLEDYIDSEPASCESQPLGTLGDYTLRRQIGRGGMGVVYEAWQGSMDRQVALKVMPKAVAVDTRAVARFIQEAQLAGKLNHPNIVHVHGMGVEQQIPYYAMDFVEGQTLSQIQAKLKEAEPEGKTPFGFPRDDVAYYSTVARCFADVTDGLQHAHSHKIIHRDIKPSNLILDREGRLRILDFGLARLEGQETLTLSGDIVGTPQYMSPEQARRKKIPIDHRTDIYSLGATLYEMLTLAPPFRGKDHEDTLSQIIERDPVEPSRRNPRVPRELETIVLKCLRKEPGDRYGTAEALGQDLRRFVRGDEIEARPQPSWEKVVRRMWRQKGRVAAIVCALLFLVTGGALVRSQYREARRTSDEIYKQSVLGSIVKLQVGQMLINAESAVDPGVDPFRFFTRPDARFTAGGGGISPVAMAVNELEKTVAAFPGRPDAYYQRARGLLLLGRDRDAMNALDDALAADGAFVPATVLRAVLLEKSGDRNRARPGASLKSSSWAEAWRAAYAAASSRRWPAAAEAYTTLIQLGPAGDKFYLGSSLEARLGRGYAYLQAKDYFRAVEDFVSAAVLWPDLVEPVLLKGKAYYLMGQRELAETTFEATYRSAPFPDDVARMLVTLYGETMRDFEKALAWAERIKEGAFRETTRAACLNMLGRFVESLAAAKSAIEFDPGNVRAHTHLGMALYSNCRLKDAALAYSKAVELDPKDPLAHCWFGGILGFLGRQEEALVECRKATELTPDYVGGYIIASWCLPALGRSAEAMAEIGKAFDLAPKCPVVLMELAFRLALEGKYEEAERRLQEAAEIAPKFYQVFDRWGDVLRLQGKLDEALSMYRKALELASIPTGMCPPTPGGGWVRCNIARVLERQGKLEEAFRECCLAEESPDYATEESERLLALLRGLGDRPGFGKAFDDIAERLEPLLDQDYRNMLQTVALARLHGEKGKDIQKAFEYIQRSVEKDGLPNPMTSSVLAEAFFLSGEIDRAVLTLEEALCAPGAKRYLALQLDDYRQKLLPDLVSYASIDATLATSSNERAADGKLLEALRSYAQGGDAGDRLEYLEARILERAGDHSEAARKLRILVAREPSRPEPLLQLAEILRAAGDPEAAERELRAALQEGSLCRKELWDMWSAICLVDLMLEPGVILADFPQSTPQGYGADVHWLLERLKANEPVRIDCGGEGFISPGGVVWGHDRFFCGGVTASFDERNVANTEDDPLYYSVREFPEDQYAAAAYRVPLPKGTYRVTLHFAELYFLAPDQRRFDVLIEGREAFKNYEPRSAGFATADRKSFETELDDGVLDIELVHQIGDSMINAIEIERRRE